MEPTVGRIVHYYPNKHAAELISRRADGNRVNPGRPLAALVVGVNSPASVNLRVFADGHNDVWMTSVSFDADAPDNTEAGISYWTWPTRQGVAA